MKTGIEFLRVCVPFCRIVKVGADKASGAFETWNRHRPSVEEGMMVFKGSLDRINYNEFEQVLNWGAASFNIMDLDGERRKRSSRLRLNRPASGSRERTNTDSPNHGDVPSYPLGSDNKREQVLKEVTK